MIYVPVWPILNMIISAIMVVMSVLVFVTSVTVGKRKRYLFPIHAAMGIYFMFLGVSRFSKAVYPELLDWPTLIIGIDAATAFVGMTTAVIGVRTLQLFILKETG